MKQLPKEIIFLDLISSKELANELDNIPEGAKIERVDKVLYVYF